jgi:hypothetical protein
MIGDSEHLRTISGHRQRAAVRRWCRRNGIKYFLDSKGWPVTTPAALDRALAPAAQSGPDWSPYVKEKPTATQGPRQKRALLLG